MKYNIFKDLETGSYFTSEALAKIFDNMAKMLREKPEDYNDILKFEIHRVNIWGENDVYVYGDGKGYKLTVNKEGPK